MKHRGRWMLVALAAALIAAAIYVSTARRTERAAGAGELLYPALEATLDDVTAVRIKGPGDATVVTLERAATGWTVAERAGYPADSSHVRTLLLGLAQARTVEEKTSLPANYPSLGVEDLATAGATGTGVDLEGLTKPVSLIVGKSPNGRSSYVRRKGEAPSWQIGVALSIERDPAKWLATELVDIGAERIQSAELMVDGKRSWKATKANRADLDFTVTGKPASAPDSSGDRVATALAGLRLVDVRPAVDPAKDKPAATATYRTFDGLVLAIDGFSEGNKRYVRLRPSVDETAPQRFVIAPAAPSEKPAETTTPETVLARTRAEATKLETRLKGWSFEIPNSRYDTIFP